MLRSVDDTISEIIIILLVVLTCGVYLLINKSKTNKSYIHKILKPIDDIMYDPKLDK